MICVFLIFFIGTNLTFIPLHLAGIQGIPRKIIDYPDQFTFFHILGSIGSLITFLGLLVFNFILLERVIIFRSISGNFYNFRRPSYSLRVSPIPDSFSEEVLNSTLH